MKKRWGTEMFLVMASLQPQAESKTKLKIRILQTFGLRICLLHEPIVNLHM